MAIIKFAPEERDLLSRKIQDYLRDELDQEVGQFDAEFLLDFFAEEIGAYFYNRGLYDARAVLDKRMESVAEAIYELEKPTAFSR